jgi:hypothetical protein
MEKWKDIPGYEGIYQASNMGLIRSLDRFVTKRGRQVFQKGKILKLFINACGYMQTSLQRKTRTVHRLVMYAFRGISSLHIDHKNRNKTDNRLSNLRYVTRRVNAQYFNKSKKSTSKYVGVHWQKEKGRWCDNISNQNKTKNIG